MNNTEAYRNQKVMTDKSHLWRRLLGLVILGALAAVFVGCTPSHPQSTFDTFGPVSESQRTLFLIIFWTGLVVFVTVITTLVFVVLRYRRKSGDEDPEQIHGSSRLELAWTIAPAVIIVFIAVPTIITIFDNANSPNPPEEGGLVVEAIGRQWWFEFRYPEEDILTANEMHIPVGEVINIKLESVDVIHSFWVPKLAGKMDMIPNNENFIWIQADEPGEYSGQCAEFCGIAHANMRFTVIAESREEYEAWLTEQSANALVPSDPLAQEGEALFMSREGGCFACHTVRGTDRARGNTGPDLTHFASRGRFAGSIMENSQAALRKWLEDPHKEKPGNTMALNAGVFNGTLDPLTEPQISALVAYLESLE